MVVPFGRRFNSIGLGLFISSDLMYNISSLFGLMGRAGDYLPTGMPMVILC